MNKRKLDQAIEKLTRAEKKIFDAVMSHYPATDREYAYFTAINGGVRFQFIPK